MWTASIAPKLEILQCHLLERLDLPSPAPKSQITAAGHVITIGPTTQGKILSSPKPVSLKQEPCNLEYKLPENKKLSWKAAFKFYINKLSQTKNLCESEKEA